MPQTKKFTNNGKLHRVKCEWCGLKMACSCFQGDDPTTEHILVLCPKCQVTEFLNLLFGEKSPDKLPTIERQLPK